MSDTVDMPNGNPSRKVVGATVGAGSGAVVANLLLWILDDYAFDPSVADSVPAQLVAFVIFIVPVVLAYVGGYITKRSAAELAPPEHRA